MAEILHACYIKNALAKRLKLSCIKVAFKKAGYQLVPLT